MDNNIKTQIIEQGIQEVKSSFEGVPSTNEDIPVHSIETNQLQTPIQPEGKIASGANAINTARQMIPVIKGKSLTSEEGETFLNLIEQKLLGFKPSVGFGSEPFSVAV